MTGNLNEVTSFSETRTTQNGEYVNEWCKLAGGLKGKRRKTRTAKIYM